MSLLCRPETHSDSILQNSLFCNRKIRCNGNLDGCAHCSEKEQECRFEAVPDDEKLKARTYKRQLIKRRQETRVHWDRAQYPEPMLFASAYNMAPPSLEGMVHYAPGYFTTQTAPIPSTSHMQQHQTLLASPFSTTSTPSPMELDLNHYFAPVTSPNSSAQLQSVTGISRFPHSIPAPLNLEALNSTPALSSSLSSPALSISSSTSSLLTPVSEGFPEISASTSAKLTSAGLGQVHYHDFAGGLELYNVPCAAPTVSGITSSDLSYELAAMHTPAPSAESSVSASPDHYMQPLPAAFDLMSAFEPAAASSALAVAFA